MIADDLKQLSISYIGDLTYNPPEDVRLVNCDEDYVNVCREVVSGCNSGDNLIVWVRSKIHFTWFKDFIQQIGHPSSFNEMTARKILAENWNVSIPDWLTDEDVLEQKLLDIPVKSHCERESFITRLLVYFFGTAFQSDMLDKSNLAAVIKAIVKDESKVTFTQYPIIIRALEIRCEEWAQVSKDRWAKNISGQLCVNAYDIWQWLSFWNYLHGYPEKLLEFVLSPEQVQLVSSIPVEAVSDLPIESTIREEILSQIEQYFKDYKGQITSSDQFQKILGRTSGRLYKEYLFVSKILNSSLFTPTLEDVQKVQAKFRLCPGVSDTQLNLLRFCVAPPKPNTQRSEAQLNSREWIRWATEEYIPYRAWQIHSGHYDEELETTVELFSDWFLEEYSSIHSDPNLSLIHHLRDMDLSESGNFSLILLIDCLPINFMELMENALRDEGFSRHELNYRFAALPTTTEYNKSFLLSGEWYQTKDNYEAVLKIRSIADWNNKKVIYLSNLKALSEMVIPSEDSIVLLNLIDGDELLHSDLESKNMSYEEELHSLFSRLVKVVSRLSKEWAGRKECFNVHVITDHGACRILEEETHSFDSKIVNNLFPNEKHRYAVIEEKHADDIPDNLWALGYKFKQPFDANEKIFFLPKGHNTVRRSTSVRGYLHGGVTPEEVLVPAALFKLISTSWKTPSVRFLDLDLIKDTGRAKFYVQRVVVLKVEIQNQNSVDIRVLRISVKSPETDLKSCDTPVINAESVGALRLSCYFKKTSIGEKNLEVEIVYELSGEQNVLSLTLESEFKSAMSGGFNLKDL